VLMGGGGHSSTLVLDLRVSPCLRAIGGVHGRWMCFVEGVAERASSRVGAPVVDGGVGCCWRRGEFEGCCCGRRKPHHDV
jgi:hypothetical protein